MYRAINDIMFVPKQSLDALLILQRREVGYTTPFTYMHLGQKHHQLLIELPPESSIRKEP